MKRSLGMVLGCGLLTICPSLGICAYASPSGASSPLPTTSTLFAEAIADAGNAGWVHEETVDAGNGHRVSMVDDIGTSSGRQVIDDNGGHMTVLVMDGATYVEGDTEALEHDLDAPPQDATELAGRWLSIPPGNPLFKPVSDAVTLESDFSQVRFNGPLKRGAEERIDGTATIPITGTLAGTPHHERVRGNSLRVYRGSAAPNRASSVRTRPQRRDRVDTLGSRGGHQRPFGCGVAWWRRR